MSRDTRPVPQCEPLLQVQGLQAGYGSSQVLFGLDFELRAGEVITLLGRNGMGKSTTMRTVMGLTRLSRGEVLYEGRSLRGQSTPHRVRAGIGMVPEDRRIFAELTVTENLEIAARGGAAAHWTLERVFDFFPELKPHAQRRGGLLSGGQQQMLTIGRTLMTNPRLLLLDEPSEGLAPLLVERILDRTQELKRSGLTLLIAEQNLGFSLQVSDRVYVLERGQVRHSCTAAELARDEALQHQLLSI